MNFHGIPDLQLFRGLLDILPFATNDRAARNALWTVLAHLLVHIKEREMGASTLLQYVSVLVNKSDIIEDDLLDLSASPLWGHQSTSTSASSSAVATSVSCIRDTCFFMLLLIVYHCYLSIPSFPLITSIAPFCGLLFPLTVPNS